MKTILIPVPTHAPKEKMKRCIDLLTNKATHKLHLFHVLTYPPAVELADVIASSSDDILEELEMNELMEFESFAEDLKKEGYQVEISEPTGFFDQEFLHLAARLRPSLILLFSSGSHTTVEDILGTNTSHVFEKVVAPVLVITADAELNDLQKAIVCLPLENENLLALKDVFHFANELDVELDFVKIDSNFQLDIINDETVFHQLQNIYPGKIPAIIHRRSDKVSDGLQEYAKESNADLMVLFTTKRNFVEKLFHKSVTKDLVLHAKKPLLIYHY